MSVDSNTPLDPRIQLELEKLNSATDNINRFEVELEVSAVLFCQPLNVNTQLLAELSTNECSSHTHTGGEIGIPAIARRVRGEDKEGVQQIEPLHSDG